MMTDTTPNRIQVEGLIHAPAQVVWAVITDFEAMPEWTASVSRVRVLSRENATGIGTRVRIHQPRLAPATWVVDAWHRGSSFSWTSRFPGVRTTATHTVTPASENSSSVSLVIEHRGLLARPVGRLTAAVSERYMAMELAGLTKRAEARLHG